MAIEGEAQRLNRSLHPREMTLELDEAVVRIEQHRLDEIERRAGGRHEAPLGEAFAPFSRGLRIGDHARTEADAPTARALHHQRADGDVEGRVPWGVDPADRARVEPTRARLDLGGDLHRAQLGSAGDRSAGEGRLQHAYRIAAGDELGGDGGGHLVDGGIGLDLEQGRHGHAARHCDPRQVVADQIDDHEIFGALLGISREFLRRRRVGHRIGAACRRPLHRPRLDPPAVEAEEHLG